MPASHEPEKTLVIPDYELLRPIGKGSYGEVWLARSVTGVFRVIKIVRRDRFEDERPFLRELEGITRFQSAASGRPRQLALLHVGRNVEGGYFYYVMEPADDAEAGSAIDPDRYVPLTLKELFRRRGRLPPAECVQLTLELARGLEVLHEANLIHRDIKPSNIIFVQGVPKLADVGLVATSEATMTCVGTPGYVPPEGPGAATGDIYSLGKVLYELATGFDRAEYPRLPSDIADGSDTGLLREINSIILRACHPDPKGRQASAHALARELELVQAGKSVAFYEGMRKRLRAMAAVAAVFVALALVTVGLVVWRSDILGEANRQIRRALYRSDLAVAQLAKATGDLGGARAALERQIPADNASDLRGIEWSILTREVQGEGTPLEPIPDSANIRKIMVDPTGTWVAAALEKDRAAVWNLKSSNLTRMIEGVRVLGGFSENGDLILDEPNRALRYESPTGESVRRVETRKRLVTLLPEDRVLVVSPDGDFVLSVIDRHGEPLGIELNVTQRWPEFGVSDSDISPDSTKIALGLLRVDGARRQRSLAAVDLRHPDQAWRVPIPGRIIWIRCSPDNIHFAANIGGLTPTIFRFNNSQPKAILNGHTARVQDAAFSPDGSQIATAGADQTIRIWEVETGKLLSTHQGLGRPAAAVAWTADKSRIVAGDDGGNIRVFPLPAKTAPVVRQGFFADVHGDLVFSPSGDQIAVTTDTGSIALVATKDLEVTQILTNLFQPIAFDSTDNTLWAFSSDWSVKRRNLTTGTSEHWGSFIPDDFSVHGWAVSPHNRNVVLSGTLGRLALIDLSTPQAYEQVEADGAQVWALTFSSDSKEFWTGSESGAIRRRRTLDGSEIELITTADGEVQALALSPDGRWTAAAIYGDSTVRIWDRINTKWLPVLIRHRRFVQSLIFTPDSKRLISAGADGRVLVWRVPEFEEIAAFGAQEMDHPTGDEGISVLRLSPAGSALGALTEDGRLQIWRAL